jgi:hypothetical protein
MTGRTIQARCQHNLGRHNLGRRVEPIAPTVEPSEPMTGVQFVTAHPALARALARLAVETGEREVPAAVPRSRRIKARDDRDR